MKLRIPVLTKGSTFTMHLHTYSDVVTIQTIEWAEEVDANGAKVRKEKPALTKSESLCMLRILTRGPVPLEKCEDLPALGRFTLRDEGRTIALGKVMKFVPANKENSRRIALPGAFKKPAGAAAEEGKTIDKATN